MGDVHMCCSKERDKRNFVNEYVRALNNGRGAIFAGAGLSIPSKGVNWKELLRNEAKAIDLDVDKETDLISVAQYIFNESRTRQTITRLLKNEINKKGNININHEIISSLPIKKVWTTNYDDFLEKSFESVGKIADIKRTVYDMATEIDDADLTIYKMHGDIGVPNSAVLLKDDYEIYEKKNGLFTKALKSDLLSNTFLFIGFSFDDPNLASVLSKVRIMLEDNPRIHYCLLKRIQQDDERFSHLSDDEKVKEYKYELNKQQLKISDLMRYGIKAILVDSYEEITSVLESIKRQYLSDKIFVSGAYNGVQSFLGYENEEAEEVADEFCNRLGKALFNENFYVSSGFGIGVGRNLITGYLQEEAAEGNIRLNHKLIIRPFPIQQTDKEKSEYRRKIQLESGVSIFLFGNRLNKGEIELSPGVKEEYDISKELGHFVIPIGVTKYQAGKLWRRQKLSMSEHINDEKVLENYMMLNDETKDMDDIIRSVVLLIKEYKNNTEEYKKLTEEEN